MNLYLVFGLSKPEGNEETPLIRCKYTQFYLKRFKLILY